MRTILQILLTASVIVHFSGVIAFAIVELKMRLRRFAGADVEGSSDDDLVIEPQDELALARSRRKPTPSGVTLVALGRKSLS